MRLLFARIGVPYCTNCGRKISTQSVETICDSVLKDFKGEKNNGFGPYCSEKKRTYEKLFEQIKKDGYSRIRLNREILSLDEEIPPLDRQKWHNIEIVVDRIVSEKSERSRLFEAIQTAINASKGDVMITFEKTEKIFSQNNACPYCGLTVGDLEPRTFHLTLHLECVKLVMVWESRWNLILTLVIPDKTKSILDGAIVPWSGKIFIF